MVSASGFHVFTHNDGLQATQINRYDSADGSTWSGPTQVVTISPPKIRSTSNFCGTHGCGTIFYATVPDAAGSANGRWVLAFAGWDSAAATNDISVAMEGYGIDQWHSSTGDMFVEGVTTSDSGDYWLNFHTYQVQQENLPIAQGAVYQNRLNSPQALLNRDIDPTSWLLAGPSPGPLDTYSRCGQTMNCYVAGDYMRPSSNMFASSSLPFIKQSDNQSDLFQMFAQDPQGDPPSGPVRLVGHYPLGTNLRTGPTPSVVLLQLLDRPTVDISMIRHLMRK